jgi:two-component system alkaline phosphatase synthesis response regulator PhoP
MDDFQAAATKSIKILVVDDEKAIAKAMQIKLQKLGYEATAVFDGGTAIKELETGQYVLVLLDLMMPVVDGWDVLKAILEKKIKVKVIITSNLSQEEDKRAALELGAIDFLVKSDSTLASIAEKVKSYLEPTP